MAFRRQLNDQLSRWQPWSIERMLGSVGSLAGIAALIFTFLNLDHLREDIQTRIFVGELSALCAGLIAYLYVTSRKKLHRYAQAVFYLHYVVHSVRDEIASMEAGQAVDLQELIQDIVDATSNCFSLLSGKRCRCCVQEITANQDVVTLVRDRITSTQSPDTGNHNISANTDFSNLWYGRNGCPRFFLSRNLVALWRSGRYRNSSFEAYGEPTTMSFAGLTFVTRWTLPYKATIVWPIRYIPEGCKWPVLNDGGLAAVPQEKRPFVWGFLSVDCKSKNTFDSLHAPELGAAIADAIFALLHAARMNPQRLPNIGGPSGSLGAYMALPPPHSTLPSHGTNPHRSG
jgi:hypothetical protein